MGNEFEHKRKKKVKGPTFQFLPSNHWIHQIHCLNMLQKAGFSKAVSLEVHLLQEKIWCSLRSFQQLQQHFPKYTVFRQILSSCAVLFLSLLIHMTLYTKGRCSVFSSMVNLIIAYSLTWSHRLPPCPNWTKGVSFS